MLHYRRIKRDTVILLLNNKKLDIILRCTRLYWKLVAVEFCSSYDLNIIKHNVLSVIKQNQYKNMAVN